MRLMCPRCGSGDLWRGSVRHSCRKCGARFELISPGGHVPCAADDCRKLFIPARSDQKYCDPSCRTRMAMRRFLDRRQQCGG